MGQQLENLQIKVGYGHDDTHVLVQYSQPINNQRMTIEQAEMQIVELRKAIEALQAHQAKKH